MYNQCKNIEIFYITSFILRLQDLAHLDLDNTFLIVKVKCNPIKRKKLSRTERYFILL